MPARPLSLQSMAVQLYGNNDAGQDKTIEKGELDAFEALNYNLKAVTPHSYLPLFKKVAYINENM